MICQFLYDSVGQLANLLRALVIRVLYVIVSWFLMEYTIYDRGVLSSKLCLRISGVVVLIYSSLFHVIGDCVFNSAKICRSDSIFNFSILLDWVNPRYTCILYNLYMVVELFYKFSTWYRSIGNCWSEAGAMFVTG